MPVKLSLGKLNEAVPALGRLAALKLPVKTAYSVSKLMRAADTELGPFHEQRNRLIQEHGTEKGGQHMVEGAVPMAAFLAELKPLLDTEVELPVNPLPLSGFGNAEVAPADLIALEPFITDEESAHA